MRLHHYGRARGSKTSNFKLQTSKYNDYSPSIFLVPKHDLCPPSNLNPDPLKTSKIPLLLRKAGLATDRCENDMW